MPQVLGTQITVIAQRLGRFDAPYSGSMSLVAGGDQAVSHTYGIYLGARLAPRLDGYLDVEMARGSGISHASGLAGVTNGDVLRQGTADLGNGPYVARAFLRLTLPLSSDVDSMPGGIDQLAEPVARRRVEVIAGKLAASDMFDVNRYANSTRTQFMNWGLFQNTAWDFAADTRGYTNGLAVSWVTPRVALRAGSFQMPRQANGNVFDSDLRRARGDNVELTLAVLPRGGAVRLLAAGGTGFLLGDGALRYGAETFVESYYRGQVGPYLQVSPDVQYVRNPGYNRDRGPAWVTSLRANLRY